MGMEEILVYPELFVAALALLVIAIALLVASLGVVSIPEALYTSLATLALASIGVHTKRFKRRKAAKAAARRKRRPKKPDGGGGSGGQDPPWWPPGAGEGD
jgi:membrane protein implicated in regulation of membrane protease activity